MNVFEDIRYEVDGALARITLARPDKLNACRDETADELTAAIKQADADTAVRAIILGSEGRAFGAGYDLATVEPDVTPQLDIVLEKHFNPLIAAMRSSRLPIVASVRGPCAGAAVGIALAADIVLASKTAFFYQPFLGIALVPDAGNTIFLSRMLGRVRASGLMLLGEKLSAEQALDWGLVWKLYEDAELDGEAEQTAAKLASLSPSAVAATKRLIGSAADAALTEGLALEAEMQGAAGRSPDFKEAVAAFFATRKPKA